MSELAQTWTSLPNFHPLAVHLPVALLPLAVAMDVAALLRPRATWLDRASALLYLIGALGAGLAVSLGERAVDSFVGLAPRLQPAIGEHSDWGHYVWYLFGLLALVRLGVCWRDRARDAISARGARWLIVIVAAVGLAVLARAADLGGALVYRHGLGVAVAAPSVSEAASDSAAAESQPVENESAHVRLTIDASGVVEWRPLPQDAQRLGEVAEAVQGTSLEVLSPASPEMAGTGVTLEVDGRVVLALAEEVGDVQVDAELELVDFEGAVGVAHHLGSEGRGGSFLVSTDGTARLVDQRDGRQELLDEQAFEAPAGSFVLAVSSAGRHLKGLVDGETVTHGHVDAPPPGACGLVLDGRGAVRIAAVVVTPLDH